MTAVSRESLEKHQVWVYLVAVSLGAGTGLLWPKGSQRLDVLVWPTLGLLLYATFTQMNLADVPRALKDTRFLLAALVGNFMIIPAVVFGIISLMPSDEAMTLGCHWSCWFRVRTGLSLSAVSAVVMPSGPQR